MLARALRTLAVCAAALLVVSASCKNTLPNIFIESPAVSSFTTASSVLVEGRVSNAAAGEISDVLVNGVSVLPLGLGNRFSATVPVDPVAIFNPILAELHMASGKVIRDRVTVVAGDGAAGPGGTGFVADGGFSPQGVALRLNDSGLDAIEPVVVGSVNIDLGSLVPVGTYVTSVTAVWNFDIYIDNPPPSYGQFLIDIDSQTNQVAGDIDLTNLRIDLFLDGTGFLAPDCTAEVTAPLLEVNGNYGLQPAAGDPSTIDVVQQGGVSFGNTVFDFEITSGFVCEVAEFFGIIGDNINQDIESGLSAFLNDPDGSGPADGPIAAEIENALATIEISGPIGEAIGVNLETPLFDVFEDPDGITLDSDARVTASMPLPAAPDLDGSYHVNEAFPSFGPLAPGGLPYDLGLCISTSAFNQLLKAETESGLLRLTGAEAITEFDLDGPGGQDPVPLTGHVLSAFAPQFAALPLDNLYRIELKPELAPIITGAPGPAGELSEIRIAHLVFEVRDQIVNNLYLTVAVDIRTGTDISFANGELSFQLGGVASQDVNVDVLVNNIGTNEVFFEQVVVFLVPQLLPSLGDVLGTFPIPDFLGLSLSPVETGKNGEFLSIFADLTAGP